jgi:hypothetical protein
MKPRRFIRLFKPRFADMVRRGVKTQTVRPVPKRMPAAGDLIECRYWSGKPYRSKQEWCAEGRIVRVCQAIVCEHEILIGEGIEGAPMGGGVVVERWASGEFPDKEEFARADGFDSWEEMREWFRVEHGLPFTGILIQWELLQEGGRGDGPA